MAGPLPATGAKLLKELKASTWLPQYNVRASPPVLTRARVQPPTLRLAVGCARAALAVPHAISCGFGTRRAASAVAVPQDSEVLKLAGEIDELSAKAMGICGCALARPPTLRPMRVCAHGNQIAAGCLRAPSALLRRLPDFDIEDADWRVAVETYNALGRHARACLSAYLMFRLSRVMELRWEAAATLPEANRAVLSEAERGFADGYDQVLATYMDDLGYGLDLTNGSLPPKDLYVEVRVHRNAGSIVLESGAVLELRANEMHFLRRSDVEPLIRQVRVLAGGVRCGRARASRRARAVPPAARAQGLVEHCYQ